MIEAKLESLIKKTLDEALKTKLNVSTANQYFRGSEPHEENVGNTNQAMVPHIPIEGTIDQVNSINNFDRREQKGVFSNTYNPNWRNHPNLFWGGNQQGASHGNQWSQQGGYGGNQQFQSNRSTPYQQYRAQYSNQSRDSHSHD